MNKNNKQKKAQLQMGENVIVLIIFFFLLVIAVIFFTKIQKSSFSNKLVENQKLASIDLKTLLLTTPELRCVENKDIIENCIDITNAENMALLWLSIKDTTLPERDYYNYRYGAVNITIKRLDTRNGNWTKTLNLYDSEFNSTKVSVIPIPVSLYDAKINDYSFGVLELRVYSR